MWTCSEVPDGLNVIMPLASAECLYVKADSQYGQLVERTAVLAAKATDLEQELVREQSHHSVTKSEFTRVRDKWGKVCAHRDQLLEQAAAKDTAIANGAKRLEQLEAENAELRQQVENHRRIFALTTIRLTPRAATIVNASGQFAPVYRFREMDYVELEF